MDEWIQALKNTSKKELFRREILSGHHSWFVCSHARPTFCNVCREALTGVTSHGLSCEVCKFKTHKRCAARASKNCKWTTLSSIGSKEIIEEEDRNICMPHQWLEGNLPVNAKCSNCDKACGSVLRMQDFRCLWCKAYVHTNCKDNYGKRCDLGVCHVSILPPTHINSIASDGYIQASKAPNSSPLVVFVNSKSGDNQGVKFLRKFKQLLNPFQVFDLILGGPIVGLRLFQKFDCFRVLVCGGDGSVGWVLKEIDALNLHKQCQIGVLPLGTGNDLARVLGWGAALDDDNQLPKLLESFERATTKMLDRWSIMTYEIPLNSNDNNNVNNIQTNCNRNIPTDDSNSIRNHDNLLINKDKFEEQILYHLNNLLQNDSIASVIESSQNLNEQINVLLFELENLNANFCADQEGNSLTNLIHEQTVLFRNKLNDFFLLLKNELKPSFVQVKASNNLTVSTNTRVSSSNMSLMKKKALDHSETSAAFSVSTSSSENDECDQNEEKNNLNEEQNLIENYFKNKSINFSNRNSSLYRKFILNKISKRFRNRRKIIIRANSLKRLIKQIIQFMTDKNILLSNSNLNDKAYVNLSLDEEENITRNTNSSTNTTSNCEAAQNNITKRININTALEDYEDEGYIHNEIEYLDDVFNSSASKKEKHLDYNEPKVLESNSNFQFEISATKTGASRNQSFNHDKDELVSPNNLNKKINDLLLNGDIERRNVQMLHSFTCSSINNKDFQESISKSPSSLTINRGLNSFLSNGFLIDGSSSCPLASEEQSCMSTPNTAKLSPSIDSIYKNSSTSNTNSQNSPLSRPNKLNLAEKIYSNNPKVSINILAPSNEPSLRSFRSNNEIKLLSDRSDDAPEIRIECESGLSHLDRDYDTDFNRTQYSRSPSFLDYVTSASSAALTPLTNDENEFLVPERTKSQEMRNIESNSKVKRTKHPPLPLFLLPPSTSTNRSQSSQINLNSSSSSNNLSSSRYHEFGSSLGIPASPSGYSSSGSCFSKTPLPSPRISKKYSKPENKNYLQLPGQGLISALSMNSVRRRSRSKSTDKSSSPTSPSSPKFSFKYNPGSTTFGFIGQALLFNADALCAPITPPVVNEPVLDLYGEKAVMNNYFGIGIDAKLCLEFHMTREEHPEKCKSRIRNHMLYGILGSKELVQRTYKNLEQKVLLECDGTKIPLKNVQGIVVLNIPSYTGGVNFWGHNSKDENIFISPSFDDKILEVVAISGAVQMALSRVVSLKSNRIAQCRSVKIQILGQEGVPVQVDGEAWIQPPGFIHLLHKNRAQMLTRNKVFEHTLKTWSEKQKHDPHLSSAMTKEEFAVLQSIVNDAISLIKRVKTASLRNVHIEQDLYGYANQASSNLEEINFNGKIDEKSLRQQVTDFLNSIRTLHVETGIFINEKASKLGIESDIIEKIQLGLNDLKGDMKKLNDCHGIFQFPLDNNEEEFDAKRISRFNIVQRYKKSKLKHKDDKELLKTLHSIPLEDWGPDEVGLWLESLNLSEYKAAFIRHDIRGTEIRNLERRDLRELGIVKVGHIKRILNASKDIPKRVAIEKQSV